MIPIERHQRILALVEQRGAVSINELTEILGVSHMTIRRDVSKLEEQGLLVSVSGGVRAVSRLAAEPSHLVKSTLQSEEKQAIGALAASHIAKNSCIYLDAGTTTLALARAILDRNDLQVVTNDFGHCCKVSDEAAFCLIQRPYISKTLLTRRISPRGSP
ncbi:DeoR family transcriptional regulator [Acinetobacter baumannii]